jgi:hypothetical protein
MQKEKKIWFAAKKYGYGWGLPVRWQGWLVLVLYAALVFGGIRVFIGGKHAAYFVLYMTALSVALFAICAWKGDAPRWRWGGK